MSGLQTAAMDARHALDQMCLDPCSTTRLTPEQAGQLRAAILRVLRDGPLPWYKLLKRTLAAQPGWDPRGLEAPEWTKSRVRGQLGELRRRGFVERNERHPTWVRTGKLW